jgi:NCAIR mutase (PurE)-related protein
MEKKKIISILTKVKKNAISVDEAFNVLKDLPYEDLGFAKVDHHRVIRSGSPEVIFCQNKDTGHIVEIFKRLNTHNKKVLLTRADRKVFERIKKINGKAVFNKIARVIYTGDPRKGAAGKVAVVCAGTADIPVAEEAALTAGVFGARVVRVYDVGVAGVHRLISSFRKIADANAIVAVAGMDGALPSVVGGLAACPVIAVPTSVGYGASFGGMAPLLTMMNSCSPNVTVVNIDNGFGAGYNAALINRMAA